MSETGIEQENPGAAAMPGPRITMADIEANIAGEYFFTAEQAVQGATKDMVDRFLCWKLPDDFAPDCGITFKREGDYEHPEFGRTKFEPIGTNLLNAEQAKDMLQHVVGCAPVMPELKLLTFCVLVLRNGFAVTGESACVSPENFNAEKGREVARENAIDKIWPLMGYELKARLAQA